MLRSLLPLVIVLAAVIGYFVLSTGFGVFQAIPWPHLLIAAAASLWALAQAAKTKRVLAVISAILCLAFTGLYAWYTLSYSAYASTAAVAVGERPAVLADLELKTQSGTPAAVLAGQATLVVLYRGYW